MEDWTGVSWTFRTLCFFEFRPVGRGCINDRTIDIARLGAVLLIPLRSDTCQEDERLAEQSISNTNVYAIWSELMVRLV